MGAFAACADSTIRMMRASVVSAPMAVVRTVRAPSALMEPPVTLWPDDDEVAHSDVLDGDVYLHAVTTHASSRRTQGVECPDGIGRLTLRPMLQPLAQQDQGDDRGRCFEVQMRHAVLGMLVEEVDREPVGR